ncbi:UNKNOWN [Stylonychia lemnae]|uniref:UDENN domain-containing protein n=1 Tax=Stylonychia lemnae TaxID=5949 RepID=A0A077ZZF6_STYLE|nr:UNKNOWN [Stylonychia lemnae]|eukprot:CDW73888.1 UNKNOWN [Stylonychia lemnae]
MKAPEQIYSQINTEGLLSYIKGDKFTSYLIQTVIRLPLEILFEKISVNSLVDLYHSLILDKRIIIISKEINTISTIIDCLLSILYPLKTGTYSVIPIIKQSYIEFLDAPVPYIVGVQKSTWENDLSIQQLRLLELDTQIIAYNVDQDIFVIGEPRVLNRSKYLKKSLADFKIGMSLVHIYTQRMMIFQVFYNYFLRVLQNINKFQNFGIFEPESYIDQEVSKQEDQSYYQEFFQTLIFLSSLQDILDNLAERDTRSIKESLELQHQQIQKINYLIQTKAHLVSLEQCDKLIEMQNKLKKKQNNQIMVKDLIQIDTSIKNEIKETVDKNKKERYSLVQPSSSSSKKDKLNKRQMNNFQRPRRSPEQSKVNVPANQNFNNTINSNSPNRDSRKIRNSSLEKPKKSNALMKKRSRDSSNEETNQYFLFKKELVLQNPKFIQSYESSRTSIGPKLMNNHNKKKTPSPPVYQINLSELANLSSNQKPIAKGLNQFHTNRKQDPKQFKSLSPRGNFVSKFSKKSSQQLPINLAKKYVLQQQLMQGGLINPSPSPNISQDLKLQQQYQTAKVQKKSSHTKLTKFDSQKLLIQPSIAQRQKNPDDEVSTENLSFMHDDLEEESKVHQVYTNKNRQYAASIHQYYQQNTDPPRLEKQNSKKSKDRSRQSPYREVRDFSQRLKAGSHMVFGFDSSSKLFQSNSRQNLNYQLNND